MTLAKKGLWFLGGAGVVLGLSFSMVAFGWTGPSGSAPNNNTAAPVNVGPDTQTKSGSLVVNGLSANSLCLPGVNPTGGCITTWPFTSGGGGPVTGNGALYRAAVFTSSTTVVGSTKLIDNPDGIYLYGGSAGSGSWATRIYPYAGSLYGLYVAPNAYSVWAQLGSSVYGLNTNGALVAYANNSSYYAADIRGSGAYGMYVQNYYGYASGYTYAYIAYTSGAGYGLLTNGVVQAPAFYYSSDERLKKNIETISNSDALKQVLALRPVTYNWKDPKQPTKTQLGFIAQEVEKVMPSLVDTNEDTGLKSVDYARVVPVLVGAIKDQQEQINELKAEVSALKSR